MKHLPFVAACAVALSFFIAGASCSDPSSAGTPQINDEASVSSDGAVSKACPRTTPTVATDTGGLAQSAAECGQPAFSWLSDPELGDVTATANEQSSVASSFTILVAASGIAQSGALLDVTTMQLAYKTQDRGKSIDATALIAFPSGATSQTSYDTLLVLHGTAGFTDSCAPSSDPSARPLIAALASLGFIVVAPDYIGLRALEGPTGFLHPYLVAQPTAIASLDAVRAAQKLVAARPEGTCASHRFVAIGGSQGGLAALWVDRLAPYYAPELELDGVVATVPPADLVAETNRALTQEVPASENAAAFFAASSDWYGTRPILSQALVPPLDVDVPDAMANTCDPSPLLDGKTLAQVFTPQLLAAAQSDAGITSNDPFGCLVSRNGITSTPIARRAPTAPGYGVLFVLGESDTLVNPPIERAAFQTLCSQGMHMQFLECAGAGHTKVTTWALPELVDFARDRFAGNKPAAALDCQLGDPVKCRATPK